MTDIERLTAVDPNFSFLALRWPGRGSAVPRMRWDSAGFLVRCLRGSKMRTPENLFDEFAAALQFPKYFGENWNALQECVADLDWLQFGRGIVLLFDDSRMILADSDPDEMFPLLRSLSAAQQEFAEAISIGESWDRPPVPFHVVLVEEDNDFEFAVARWQAAGVRAEELILDGED